MSEIIDWGLVSAKTCKNLHDALDCYRESLDRSYNHPQNLEEIDVWDVLQDLDDMLNLFSPLDGWVYLKVIEIEE